MLTDITEHQVEVLATENVMTPELQAAFRKVLDQKKPDQQTAVRNRVTPERTQRH
jgi:hypothetical protein